MSIPSSLKEDRFAIYTNDVIILALSDFPYFIARWRVLTSRLVQQEMRTETPNWIVTDRLVTDLKARRRTEGEEAFRPILEHIGQIDAKTGFTPKVVWMECITPDLRHLVFRRQTVRPRAVAENGYQDYMIEMIGRVWSSAISLYPKALGIPIPDKYTPSILILEEIDGSANKARDFAQFVSLYYEITEAGNSLAKTPICYPVYRIKTRRQVWEYLPTDKKLE